MAASVGYLLDTNILVNLIRGKELGQQVDQRYGISASIANCVICVVTVGEMKSLAKQLAWGGQKLSTLDHLLARVPWIDITDAAVLDAYGEIDSLSKAAGRKMGKNDVWIAAVAHITRMTLLTTDKDFDHLDPSHLKRDWIDPTLPSPDP